MAKSKVQINEYYLDSNNFNSITKSKLMLNVDSDLKKNFRIKCLENDTSMSEAISDFMKGYIDDSSSNKKLNKRQSKRAL